MSQPSHANFFSTVRTPCCVVGFEYSFRQVNDAFLDVFGYSAADMKRMMFSELVHVHDLPQTEQILEELSASSVPRSFPCRMRHRDGHFLDFLWQATPSAMEFAFYAVGIEISAFLQQTQHAAQVEMQENLVILQEKYADLELMYQELQARSGQAFYGDDFEWQAIVNCMREGVVTREPNGKLYTLNPQRTEEIIGSPLTKEEFEILWKAGKAAKSPANPVSFVFSRLGHVSLTLKVFALQHVAEDGKTLAGRTIIFSDVTAQSKMQKSLRLMEEDWSLLTAHLIGVMEWQINTGHVHYSGSWSSLLGLPPHQLGNDLKVWQSHIHPGDFPLVTNSLKLFLANPNAAALYENVHRLQHHKGNYRWFKLTGEAKRGANGKAERFIASFQDITERKRLEDALHTAQMSEKALRNERIHYETLFNAVPVLIIYKDCNNHIVRMNHSAETWLRAVGVDPHSGNADQYFLYDQEVITTGQAKRGVVEKLHDHDFRMDKLPYRDADGKILGVIVLATPCDARHGNALDITEE